MTRQLPYPGHSWSFTQHAVGLEPKTLYDLLKCAAPFEGNIDGYGQKITELMIASGVLTANERNGTPDAWRDYQQLLAELGLIYSTKICRALTLTELGHMLLAGEIGFSELVGVQALRFQYPNGQKSTIQSRLREELASSSISCPKSLTELQADRQILLKPGALILRILIELYNKGLEPSLSVSECQAFLIPCRTNSEWTMALSEIVVYRKSMSNIDNINRHSRRNIQDWFKFLQKSDFFESGSQRQIFLSSYAKTNIDLVNDYCASQEEAASFWIPVGFNKEHRLNWFDWYGHIPFEAQKALRFDVANNAEYLEHNYIAGVEEDIEEENDIVSSDITNVNLKPLDLEHLGRDTQHEFSEDLEALVESLRNGAQKRHAKTLLHDRIIKDLAKSFIAQGATVESDPGSIDLFATWPTGDSAIFEVKTVTRRSFQNRIRTAIGQVEEYAYRRKYADGSISDRVIVVNTDLDSKAWQTAFLTDHLGIGLICKPTSSYSAYAPIDARTKDYWLTL
ncbi:AlwI family type II restriction endonuclease [Methylovulum psychrotolerans]|uniref:Uncharacterized protein n=1 Tax=Methylovulum psychrotolerans TaxID=1704499 RepID=A0A1Z4BW05_9GAMM|nr:AlwI family type II restriction endonuclease [Methylovulum psychrotolerans]ASF45471.1 hypothetical protein CEK71_04985 [Methylovulum psychrotolerans]